MRNVSRTHLEGCAHQLLGKRRQVSEIESVSFFITRYVGFPQRRNILRAKNVFPPLVLAFLPSVIKLRRFDEGRGREGRAGEATLAASQPQISNRSRTILQDESLFMTRPVLHGARKHGISLASSEELNGGGRGGGGVAEESETPPRRKGRAGGFPACEGLDNFPRASRAENRRSGQGDTPCRLGRRSHRHVTPESGNELE